ncbi:tyrosine-type recombinase/integrase [Anaerolinea sp.]|uniref:tyrosine-type recombinase/integrase n=1 Tax=Anaerolinea sp. TaxID=1872519 RepID=UPI002ACD95D7|nr:tyrosine-type recombinase/integrase [Anaerolinea sp.]
MERENPRNSSPENTLLSTSIFQYLESVSLSRSLHTFRTYKNALNAFIQCLIEHALDPNATLVKNFDESPLTWFSVYLKNHSPATETLYLTAVKNFYEYLAAEKLADINLPRVKLLIRQRSRKLGQRLPQFPKDYIEILLEKMQSFTPDAAMDETERIRFLRDRAFLLTLADTGLRVHEACNLRRGDMDWNEGKALIIGKGNREAIVRFSTRTIHALKEYLTQRAALDSSSGKPLSSLPLFARHDKGSGKKIKPITTTTGRNIVKQRVKEFLDEEIALEITPHSFRHYFVTRVLASSGNLKLAQELARHRNIAVTQRYAHLSNEELDQGYWQAIENNS